MNALPPPSTNSVKSAMRTLDIIEFVVAHAQGQGAQGVVAQDVAGALAIPVSSLSYLLATLVERDYLRREGRRYLPGPGLERLRVPASEVPLDERVAPIVRGLRSELNETSSFLLRRGWQAEALVTEASDHALRYAIDTGARRPLHAFAAGKAILSLFDEAELKRYFAEAPRDRLTAHTRTSEADLRADLDCIRREGFAIAREEATAGISGVAVPVLIDGIHAGAFSVAVPVVRFDAALEARIKALLLRSAEALR